MPDVFIRNDTPHTLNIALSQIAPLHFENAVAPGETFKTHTGSVWFTVEWRIDNVANSVQSSKKAIKNSNRYSASKSAKTIAVVSAAGLSLVALAGPLALSAAAAAGSATAAALLQSSAVLAAAGSAEAIAFSTYAATTLTTSALHEIHRSTGTPSKETSEELQKKMDSLSTVIAASSLTGAAKSAAKGSVRKALISAGTTLVGKIGARTQKDKTKDYDQRAADAGLGPPGKTFR
ncbi:uncharacterized protein EI90DRAFT_2606340 [Cantharellus anzutake]|uniref:uncharacterized protein n=1 Tax=Cantharellus anzutake TaxID=1750568 RepID=UPI0019077196|nr:uncharacterized protein EI90DRAFT_2606340 [Cantharellus anzutake]KAF8320605.1 hypothetical protein EI90DRAFT_2606340 [Cantharellus anzutake]